MNDVKAEPEAPPPGRYIPVRRTDILERLAAQAGSDEAFRKLCRILVATCHYEYLAPLEKLREAYFYFNPERDPHAGFGGPAREQAYRDFMGALEGALREANFSELSHAEIERAHRDNPVVKVAVRVSMDDFREVRFFQRGHRREGFPVRRLFGLRRRTVLCDVYDDVILVVAVRNTDEIAEDEVERLNRARLRPGSILIKHFRQVAAPDLRALFPNVRVLMSLFDKVKMGIPAIAGGVPIFLKLFSTVTVLFAVTGFYLGLRNAVAEEEIKTALVALGGILALGGFLLRQWVSYQRQTLKYHKTIADNFYFRNIANNAGIFDSVVGMAEDQECKETILAYWFLLTAPAPPDRAALKARVEQWLAAEFGGAIAFDVDDALGVLRRLGLLERGGDNLAVLPVGAAIARLDHLWDRYFTPIPEPSCHASS